MKDIVIEGYDLIEIAMAEQNKGLLRMSKRTGVSAYTIANARDGGNVTLDTLLLIMDELGLRMKIERDENANPEVLKPHGRKMKPVGRHKKAVPMRRGFKTDNKK